MSKKSPIPNKEQFLIDLRWCCYRHMKSGQGVKLSEKTEIGLYKRLFKAAGFEITEADIKFLTWAE